MVKITDGKNIIEVTKGAFETIYKSQGFRKMPDEKKNNITKPVDVSKESKEDEFVKSLEEKPISTWSKEEVKSYCSIVGIDISGTKNAKEAKEIIKEFIAEK